MSEIDFYFSIGSTYTYLSVTRILDVEKQHQVKFNWKPFSVRAIMKEMNNIPFPKDKMNKVNYMWRDIERRAEGYGFFAKTPVPYPLSEFDLANQIAILGFEKGWGEKFVILAYKKWFQEGKEPAIEPSISEVCSELKLDKDEIVSEAKSSDIETTKSAIGSAMPLPKTPLSMHNTLATPLNFAADCAAPEQSDEAHKI